jgi:hypothetical protein
MKTQKVTPTPAARARGGALDTYFVFRRGVGAALEQYLHHRSVPENGGFVQAGIKGLVRVCRYKRECVEFIHTPVSVCIYTHAHTHVVRVGFIHITICIITMSVRGECGFTKLMK